MGFVRASAAKMGRGGDTAGGIHVWIAIHEYLLGRGILRVRRGRIAGRSAAASQVTFGADGYGGGRGLVGCVADPSFRIDSAVPGAVGKHRSAGASTEIGVERLGCARYGAGSGS